MSKLTGKNVEQTNFNSKHLFQMHIIPKNIITNNKRSRFVNLYHPLIKDMGYLCRLWKIY